MMAARAVTAQPGTQSCAATLSLGFVNYLVVSRGTALLRGCTRRGGERLKRFRAGVCVHVPRIPIRRLPLTRPRTAAHPRRHKSQNGNR